MFRLSSSFRNTISSWNSLNKKPVIFCKKKFQNQFCFWNNLRYDHQPPASGGLSKEGDLSAGVRSKASFRCCVRVREAVSGRQLRTGKEWKNEKNGRRRQWKYRPLSSLGRRVLRQHASDQTYPVLVTNWKREASIFRFPKLQTCVTLTLFDVKANLSHPLLKAEMKGSVLNLPSATMTSLKHRQIFILSSKCNSRLLKQNKKEISNQILPSNCEHQKL